MTILDPTDSKGQVPTFYFVIVSARCFTVCKVCFSPGQSHPSINNSASICQNDDPNSIFGLAPGYPHGLLRPSTFLPQEDHIQCHPFPSFCDGAGGQFMK